MSGNSVTSRPAGVICLIACTVSACSASAGRDVDKNTLATYQKNVTPCASIVEDLGQPLELVTEADGSRLMTYGKSTSKVRGATFVPIVGLFAGGVDTQYDLVQIKCDAQGVYQEHKSSQGAVSTN